MKQRDSLSDGGPSGSVIALPTRGHCHGLLWGNPFVGAFSYWLRSLKQGAAASLQPCSLVCQAQLVDGATGGHSAVQLGDLRYSPHLRGLGTRYRCDS